MVGIDTTFLSLMLYPKARPPQDPSTKKPVERMEDRIEKLLEDLDSESERIILPTPVLSEFLILVGKDAPAYLEKLSGMKSILIKPFDEVAAIDLAAIELQDRSRGDKRSGSVSPWAKLRFDRQIVAILRTNGAKRIYSDDEDVMKFATRLGIEVIRTWELPLPAAKQIRMEYEQNGGNGNPSEP
jgi:predicted nucleic acid-binding protein